MNIINQKKHLWSQILLKIGVVFMLFIASVQAYETISSFDKENANITQNKDQGRLKIDKVFNEDLYLFWEDISMQRPGEVNGDVFAMGVNLNFHGAVNEDLNLLGGNIEITEVVQEDLRVVGRSIMVNAKIGDDALFLGGDVEILRETSFGGDVGIKAMDVKMEGLYSEDVNISAGGEVIIGGKYMGDVTISANKIKVLDDFEVLGNMTTTVLVGGAEESIQGGVHDLQESKILGQYREQYKQPQSLTFQQIGFGLGVLLTIKLISLWVFGVWLFFALQKFWHLSISKNKNSKIKNFFVGFGYILIAPFLAIILILTGVGMPVGIFVLGTWALSFWILEIIAVAVFTAMYTSNKTNRWKKIGFGALWALFFTILPFFVDMFFVLWALGVFITEKKRWLKKMKG